MKKKMFEFDILFEKKRQNDWNHERPKGRERKKRKKKKGENNNTKMCSLKRERAREEKTKDSFVEEYKKKTE